MGLTTPGYQRKSRLVFNPHLRLPGATSGKVSRIVQGQGFSRSAVQKALCMLPALRVPTRSLSWSWWQEVLGTDDAGRHRRERGTGHWGKCSRPSNARSRKDIPHLCLHMADKGGLLCLRWDQIQPATCHQTCFLFGNCYDQLYAVKHSTCDCPQIFIQRMCLYFLLQRKEGKKGGREKEREREEEMERGREREGKREREKERQKKQWLFLKKTYLSLDEFLQFHPYKFLKLPSLFPAILSDYHPFVPPFAVNLASSLEEHVDSFIHPTQLGLALASALRQLSELMCIIVSLNSKGFLGPECSSDRKSSPGLARNPTWV